MVPRGSRAGIAGPIDRLRVNRCHAFAEADRVLSSAVPPHSGERRLVGQGFTEWRNVVARAAEVQGPLSAASARPISGSTTCAFRRRGSRRRSSRANTASTGFAITTTGSTAGGCSSGRSTRCCNRRARFSLLRVLGERELDAPLGRRRPRDPHRAEVFAGGRRALIADLAPLFRDPRYIRDRRPAARSSSTARTCCPTRARAPPAFASRRGAKGSRDPYLVFVQMPGMPRRATGDSTPASSFRRTISRSATLRGDGDHRSAVPGEVWDYVHSARRRDLAQASGLSASSRHHGRLGQHGAPAPTTATCS